MPEPRPTSRIPDRPLPGEAGWAIGLLLLALALRVGFVLIQQPGFYFEDSLDYDRAARALLETGHFNTRYYRLPLYPVFMAGCYGLFGTDLLPLRIVQALIGTLTCGLVWLTGRRLFGSRPGLLALFGAAVFPVHIVMSGIEYPVVLGTFLIWIVLWLHARRDRNGVWPWRELVAAAIVTVLASTVFEGGIVVGAFLVLLILLQRSPARIRLRQMAILVGVGSLILLPWLATLSSHRDYRPLLLKAAIHLPSAPGVDAPLWQGSGANLLRVKLAGLARNPGWTLNHVWSEFWHFWAPYPDRIVSAEEGFRETLHSRESRMVVSNSLVGAAPRLLYAIGFTILLLGAGVGAVLVWRLAPEARFLIGWPVFLGLCYSPFFTQMRYRIPADPAFILFAACALDWAVRWLRRARPGDLPAASH
jgi:4-amino-4-deoxy-L-arabinose transferase-like glycosyltransferase